MNISGDKKKILVIEDDITLRDNISDYLEASDFEVFSAGDGLEGLKKFKEILPDIVLCDITMPKLDGFKLFEEIRSKREYSEIPFIFLTARIGISDFQKGMTLGADDYIIKPFNFEQLISIIKNRINKREERLMYNRQKFQSLIENSLTGVFIHQDEKLIFFNSRFREIFGLSDDAQEIELNEIIDSAYLKELYRNLEECYNGIRQDFRIELKAKKKDGSELFIEMFAGFSIFNHKKAVLGNILDITGRYTMEQKLRKSERRYRDLLNYTPISIHEVDMDGKITFVNTEVLRSSGFSLNDVVGKYLWDFTADENNKKLTKEFFLNILKNKPKPKPSVIKVNNNAGEEQISEIYWDYSYDEDGNIKGLIIVLTDITEMEKHRLALTESEQRFKNLTEIASDWIWELDENNYFTFTSVKIFNVLGYMPEELTGLRPRDIMQKSELTRALPYLEMIAKNKNAFKSYECGFLHKNGSQVTLEISGIPFYDSDGIFKGYRGVAVDVTQKNESRLELLAANTKLSSILDNIKNIVLYETGTDNDFYSNNIFNLTGFSAKQFITKNVALENFIHQNDITDYREKLKSWEISNEKNLKLRYRIVTEDGNYVFVEDYKTKFYTDDNNYYISGILTDISERYEFEEDIQKLKQAINQNPVGVIILDEKFKITFSNESYHKITGYTREDLKYNPDPDLLINRNDFLKDEFKEAIDIYGKYEGRKKGVRKNGDEYYEYFMVTSFKNSAGQIIYYVILKQDITEIENLRKEISDADARIEESNKMRTLLLSNLNLEFRTPINVIFGYSEILKEEVESIKHKNMLAGIYSSAEKLYNTLDSVIKLMQLDSLDSKAEKKEMDLSKEIMAVANEFRQTVLSKNLYLNLNIKTESADIKGNPAMVRQIFYNIIDNAVKYTNEGGVNIIIEKFDDSGQQYFIVRISDTGIGIPVEKQKYLFKDFKRAIEELNIHNAKIGLGLSIAKKMIEFHNGSVSIESIPGQFTVLTVVLPAV